MSNKAAGTAAVSGREAEVLEAIGAHLSNAQIAGRLHISVRTVESHVSSLLRKFGVTDRRALADLAPVATARQQAGTGMVAGLPTARTRFIGRSAEQAGVLAALADSRLVTLLGPGGVGKTRLAARVAEAACARWCGTKCNRGPSERPKSSSTAPCTWPRRNRKVSSFFGSHHSAR